MRGVALLGVALLVGSGIADAKPKPGTKKHPLFVHENVPPVTPDANVRTDVYPSAPKRKCEVKVDNSTGSEPHLYISAAGGSEFFYIGQHWSFAVPKGNVRIALSDAGPMSGPVHFTHGPFTHRFKSNGQKLWLQTVSP